MGNGKRQSARLAARQASRQSTQHPGHPRRTPRFPSPMATIHDLPAETIEHILNSAYSSHPDWTERGSRTPFLLAAALVCRAWTPFAQAALWIDVSLTKGHELAALAAAGPNRHPVRKLYLHLSHPSIQVASVEQILRKVRGVHRLRVACGEINPDWLCGPNFKDLKVLGLVSVEIEGQQTLPLPFNLTSLNLSYCDPAPHTAAAFLHVLSRQASISSLTLADSHPKHVGFMTGDWIASVAPHLVTLQLDDADDAVAQAFLKHCTRLKHLRSSPHRLLDIRTIVTNLDSWTVCGLGQGDGETQEEFIQEMEEEEELLDGLADLLDSPVPGIATLKRLVLISSLPESLEDWAGRELLEDKCRKMGIQLVIEEALFGD